MALTLIIGPFNTTLHTLLNSITEHPRPDCKMYANFNGTPSEHYASIFEPCAHPLLCFTVGVLTNSNLQYVRRVMHAVPQLHVVIMTQSVSNCLASDCAPVDHVYVSKHVTVSFCKMLKIQSVLFPGWPVCRFIDALDDLAQGEYLTRDSQQPRFAVERRLPSHTMFTEFAEHHGYECILDNITPFLKAVAVDCEFRIPQTLLRAVMVSPGVTYTNGHYQYDAVRVHTPTDVFKVVSPDDVYEWFVRKRVKPDCIMFLELLACK